MVPIFRYFETQINVEWLSQFALNPFSSEIGTAIHQIAFGSSGMTTVIYFGVWRKWRMALWGSFLLIVLEMRRYWGTHTTRRTQTHTRQRVCYGAILRHAGLGKGWFTWSVTLFDSEGIGVDSKCQNLCCHLQNKNSKSLPDDWWGRWTTFFRFLCNFLILIFQNYSICVVSGN